MNMDLDPTIISIVAIIIAALLGFLLAYLRGQKQISSLREERSALLVRLEMEEQNTEEKIETLEQARGQLAYTFQSLSSAALKHNSEDFLRLAQENMKQFHIKSSNELLNREHSIENMVKPIREALERTEKQIRQIENERKETYGSLSKHIETMAHAQQMLQGETRNLVQALRRPEVRGQWGEMTLKRLAELSGMVEHCDFYEQEHVTSEEGTFRPDMVIRMPDNRDIVVDVKTPLDAYLNAMEAPNDDIKSQELERHTRNVRNRIRELASKAYWKQFKHSPDFVVLFIPGDQFLAAAMEKDHNLLESALQQKVILATPTSFVALLRAVAYGWRQVILAENADKIRELGEDLYTRLATFSEHLSKVGKNLSSSVENYNKAVGSLERQVIPGAKKLGELGIQAKKDLESIEPIDKSVRKQESE